VSDTLVHKFYILIAIRVCITVSELSSPYPSRNLL